MSQETKIIETQQLDQEQNALIKRNEHFALLVEQNEAGLFSMKDDLITYANPTFVKILQSDKDNINGCSILDFIGETDRALLSHALQTMKDGKVDRFSKEIMLNNQADYFLSLHLTVTSRTAEGTIIIGASRNATQRVQKRIELDKTKAKYEALYRNLQDGIFIYNYINETVIDCNDAALKILGFDHKSELMERTRLEIIPKTSPFFPGVDLHEETRIHGLRVIKGESFYSKGVLGGKNDLEIIANINIVPTFDQPGEAYIIFHDTTQSVKNKIALRANEGKYRDIFENSHEAIIYTDVKSNQPILCNKNALKLFGFDSIEAFAAYSPERFYADLLVEGLPAAHFFKSKMQQAITNGKAQAIYKLRKKNGEIVIVDNILVGDNSNKQQPKVISFIRDITKIHHTQISLNQKNEELKKYIDSNLQLENFAYLASHDLQTPLRSIVSFTQLLQKRTKDLLDEEAMEYMQYIINSGSNMQNLINDLLSYSRINSTEIALEEISIPQLLKGLLLELNPIIEEKKASVNIDAQFTTIFADRIKIRQTFHNLLTNALKFNRPSIPIVINITAVENNKEYFFSIQDNGIGIPEVYQSKIFLLFKRLHGPAEFEGTGIGLAMVKKIVAQHEGKIWLESKEGQGSTFHFSIPNLK